MKIQGILFDKDDTLIDLGTFWRLPVRKTAEYVVRELLRENDDKLIKQLTFAAGFDGEALLPHSPVEAGTNQDIVDEWNTILSRRGLELRTEQEAQILSYIEKACLEYGEVRGTTDFHKLLSRLKEKGIRLGVATSDYYRTALHCLDAMGISDYFDLILSADRVKAPKPNSDTAEQFAETCGIPLSGIAMVGDSVNDMKFAENSGIIGIFYQPGGRKGDLPEGADFCISDLQQILDLCG